mmetsp:Transcript_40625/g.125578  ORF Transcript_40625/g.125578 Transcript_40625/m.125578 type:complete len:171 (-) Transcript_40625:26-538(-)
MAKVKELLDPGRQAPAVGGASETMAKVKELLDPGRQVPAAGGASETMAKVKEFLDPARQAPDAGGTSDTMAKVKEILERTEAAPPGRTDSATVDKVKELVQRSESAYAAQNGVKAEGQEAERISSFVKSGGGSDKLPTEKDLEMAKANFESIKSMIRKAEDAHQARVIQP